MSQMPGGRVRRIEIDDMEALSAKTDQLSTRYTLNDTNEAKTTSLPQGDIEAEPTGLSR